MNPFEKSINHWHNSLISANNIPEVELAREYLKNRSISKESIITHKIGYVFSDEFIDDDMRYYRRNETDEMESDYNYFIRGKIIVPIYSEFGELISFATRSPTTEPGNSWWNFPFKKSHHLFLLDKTRKNIFEGNKIYIVEGYIDAIMLYQNGINTVCAIMGTQLSPRKIGLITRYCNNICVCMDVDLNNAGQKAQEKAISTLKSFGYYDSLSIIEGLPEGEDPDVYITKHGKDSFLSLERKLSDQDIKKIHRKVLSEKK